jgi:hypothetical protein
MDFHVSCFGYNKDEVERYIGHLVSVNCKIREENRKLNTQLQKSLEALEIVQAKLAVKEHILKNCSINRKTNCH